jgi:uncharacterized protein YxjI
MEAAPAGFNRFMVKSKLGVGRDFKVLDANEQQVYFVDGKYGLRPAAEIQDASGAVVYTVRGKLMGIPKEMLLLDAQEQEVARLKAKTFSIKNKMTLNAFDGREWQLEGNFLEKEYEVTSEGRVVLHITQKFMAIKDTYALDVAEDVDPAMALAVLWAVDAFVEQR